MNHSFFLLKELNMGNAGASWFRPNMYMMEGLVRIKGRIVLLQTGVVVQHAEQTSYAAVHKSVL